MKRIAPLVLLAALVSCVKISTPGSRVSMKITVQVVPGAEAGTVSVNGEKRGPTPCELDVLALPFVAELKPAAWPPPGAQVFEPTSAAKGKLESTLAVAVKGDILYVQTLLKGETTLGALRISVAGPDGKPLEFDSMEKTVSSSLGKADHSVKLVFRRGK